MNVEEVNVEELTELLPPVIRLEGVYVTEGTHPPFCEYVGHTEDLTSDGATVVYRFIIDNVPESFVGQSRREPNDAPNDRIALCLAHSRALSKVGKVLAKRSAGYVKHADDMKVAMSEQKARKAQIRETLEAALANAIAHRAAEEYANEVADPVTDEETDGATPDALSEALSHETPSPRDKRVVLDRVARMARIARHTGETELAEACVDLAHAVKRFDRLAKKAKERL